MQARRLIESHREEVGPARIAPFGSELEPLEQRIGYRFRDRGLLEHALTHRSRVHEDASGGVIDNESLEFLGDSVLGFIIADLLFRTFPQHNEGQKSKLKASLVSAASLARLGDRIGLGEFLILGRGEEKTGGRKKQALIADGYEALIAADLSGWRHRAGPGLPRTSVRRAHRRGAPHRRGADVHGGLQVRVAGMAAVARPRPAGVPTGGRIRSAAPADVRRGSARRWRRRRTCRRAEQERSGSSSGEARARRAHDALTQSDGQAFPPRAPRAAGRTQSISMIPQFFSRAPAPPGPPAMTSAGSVPGRRVIT